MQTIEGLAAQILGQQATERTIAELTACLHYGNGMLRLGGTGRGVAVLKSLSTIMDPDAEGYFPRVMGVSTPSTPKRANIGTTRMVSKHWRQIGDKAGLGEQRPEGAYRQWAPVATRSLARVTIGGPVGQVMATTPDKTDPDNTYEWYDLRAVPVGAIVYRVAGPGIVMLFQRVTAPTDGDYWVRVPGRGISTRDYGDTLSLYRQSGILAFTADLTKPRPLAFDPDIVKSQVAAPGKSAKQS